MTWNNTFLDAVTAAAGQTPGPLLVPWPMPGNLGGFISFETFLQWRGFIEQFELPKKIPQIVAAIYHRAHKLHLLAWVDFDLIKAGKLVALTALELALKDRYGEEVRDKRGNINFGRSLRYMVDQDGLVDEAMPMVRRCGRPATIVGRITGELRPSLSEVRNDLAHGYPFDGFPQAGLLELVRDLIAYAYRAVPDASAG